MRICPPSSLNLPNIRLKRHWAGSYFDAAPFSFDQDSFGAYHEPLSVRAALARERGAGSVKREGAVTQAIDVLNAVSSSRTSRSGAPRWRANSGHRSTTEATSSMIRSTVAFSIM